MVKQQLTAVSCYGNLIKIYYSARVKNTQTDKNHKPFNQFGSGILNIRGNTLQDVQSSMRQV
jgi:hypothetical protein